MADHDTELDDLFTVARRQRDHLPEGLADRILADAATVQSEQARREQPRQRPAWLQVFDFLGGWRGAGGLATACAAGIWIGLAPPSFMPDPLDLLLQQDEADLISDVTLSELYME